MTEPWLDLMRDSLLRPRVAARGVLALRVPPRELLLAAVAVTCVGIILAFLALRISRGAVDAVSARMLETPLLGAVVEFGVMAVIAFLTWRIGELFEGKGSLEGAARLVVWLNVMLLLLQVAQLVLLVTIPQLAGVLALFAILWGLWAYANFVTELHGFENPLMVLGGVVLSAIVLFIGLAMLLAILGFTPRGGI